MSQRYKLVIRNSIIKLKTLGDKLLTISGIKDVSGTGELSNNIVDWSLQHKTKTSAEWSLDTTTILLKGQLGIEDTGNTSFKAKIGNGIDIWASLNYFGGSTSVGFSDLTGNPTDNTSLAIALNSKANDNSVVHLAGSETISGLKTFDPGIVLTDSIDTSASDVNTFRLQSFNQQGFSVPHIYDAQGNAIEITRDGLTIARNVSGISYTKGQVVYVSGSTGAVPQISLAKANSLTTLGVIGVCYENIAINGFGRVMIAGNIEGLNLSAFSTGDTLYVSPTTSGLLTSIKPTYPNYAQLVGFVLNNGNGNGILNVSIRGVQGIYNGDSAVVSDITSNNATASTVPYFDSNKKLVSSTVTPVTLSYLDATSSIQIQLNNKRGAFSLSANTTNPADSTTYHWGGFAVLSPAGGTGLGRKVRPGFACTLTEASINIFINSTLGTNENVAYYIYKNNSSSGAWFLGNMTHDAQTNNLIATGGTMTFDGVSDYFTIVYVTPAYATNPVQVYHNAIISFKIG